VVIAKRSEVVAVLARTKMSERRLRRA